MGDSMIMPICDLLFRDLEYCAMLQLREICRFCVYQDVRVPIGQWSKYFRHL